MSLKIVEHSIKYCYKLFRLFEATRTISKPDGYWHQAEPSPQASLELESLPCHIILNVFGKETRTRRSQYLSIQHFND